MRYLAIMFVTLCSGCFLTLERQQSAEWMFGQAEQGAEKLSEVSAASTVLSNVLSKEEITEADVADVNTALTKISGSLSSIADNLNEIGKTANVMQEDFGAPEPANRVESKPEATIMRAKYRAKAKAFNAIKGAIAAKVGIPLPKSAPGQPWNVSEILAAVMAAAAAVKGSHYGAKQFTKYKRAAHEGHRALGELKKDVQPERFASVMEKNQGMVIIHQEQKYSAKKG